MSDDERSLYFAFFVAVDLKTGKVISAKLLEEIPEEIQGMMPNIEEIESRVFKNEFRVD